MPTISRDKITRVETIPLRLPFKETFKFSAGTRPFVEVVIVRLHCESGLTGVGETQAWRRIGSNATVSNIVHDIDDILAPLIVGQSPFDIGPIMERLDRALYHSLYSQASISDALFDLKGKLLGVPVSDLLGGRYRDQIPICAVLPIKDEREETLNRAKKFYEQGYRAFTVKVGTGLKDDVANVRMLREHFGDDVILRVDANAALDFDDALTLMRGLQPFDVEVVEQPVAPWNLDGLAELALRMPMAIMADESVAAPQDLLDIIRRRSATVIQTKQAKNGGIWGVQKLWTIAAAAGLRVYPGNHPATSIASAAVAQMAAAYEGKLIEGPFAVGIGQFGTLAADIVAEPLEIKGNLVTVPNRPGLGVTLDDDKIEQFRVCPK